MANLINLEPVGDPEAPLASGDEMTPSLEYTLDEPPPPPGGGDDDTERDQVTPSSGGGEDRVGATVFDDPPPPPSDDIMQPMSMDYQPHDDDEERLDFTPAVPVETQPAHMDMEPPPSDDFKPAAIVMPTQMVHHNNPAQERQPIYEEVNEKHNPGEDQHHNTQQDSHNNPGEEPDHNTPIDNEKDKDEMNEKEKEALQDDETIPAESKEAAEVDSVTERGELRLAPPDAPMPKHRSRCVACGCPRVCCVRNFVFLWVVLFILVQGGPLAVLILDLLGMNTHGTTISRYCSEWGMKPAVCRVSKFDPIDFDSNCTQPAKDYKCLDVEVKLFRYDKTGPFADDVPLWRSEREYVLNASKPQQPHCFNLDVCNINPNKHWYEYKNQTQKDEKILQDKIIYTQEGFVCYYKKIGEYDYIAFKEKNTSFWSALLWFFLPLAGILVCWLIVFVCLCWYCCPRHRAPDAGVKKHNGGYQEVENVDEASGDHDAGNSKEQLVFEEAGEATAV